MPTGDKVKSPLEALQAAAKEQGQSVIAIDELVAAAQHPETEIPVVGAGSLSPAPAESTSDNVDDLIAQAQSFIANRRHEELSREREAADGRKQMLIDLDAELQRVRAQKEALEKAALEAVEAQHLREGNVIYHLEAEAYQQLQEHEKALREALQKAAHDALQAQSRALNEGAQRLAAEKNANLGLGAEIDRIKQEEVDKSHKNELIFATQKGRDQIEKDYLQGLVDILWAFRNRPSAVDASGAVVDSDEVPTHDDDGVSLISSNTVAVPMSTPRETASPKDDGADLATVSSGDDAGVELVSSNGHGVDLASDPSCDDAGVELVSTHGSSDSGSSAQNLTPSLLAALAKEDSSERTRLWAGTRSSVNANDVSGIELTSDRGGDTASNSSDDSSVTFEADGVGLPVNPYGHNTTPPQLEPTGEQEMFYTFDEQGFKAEVLAGIDSNGNPSEGIRVSSKHRAGGEMGSPEREKRVVSKVSEMFELVRRSQTSEDTIPFMTVNKGSEDTVSCYYALCEIFEEAGFVELDRVNSSAKRNEAMIADFKKILKREYFAPVDENGNKVSNPSAQQVAETFLAIYSTKAESKKDKKAVENFIEKYHNDFHKLASDECNVELIKQNIFDYGGLFNFLHCANSDSPNNYFGSINKLPSGTVLNRLVSEQEFASQISDSQAHSEKAKSSTAGSPRTHAEDSASSTKARLVPARVAL